MAIQLSNSDSHLTSAVTNFPNRQLPLSLTCWVNSTVWSTYNAVSMVGVYLQDTVGIQIGSRRYNSIDVWDWGGSILISSSGLYSPLPSTWIAIGYTWSGTTHSLYANGSLITTSTGSVTAGVLNKICINGYPSGGANETSNTFVDDVSYYNRELSAAEVLTIATARGARVNISDGLVARYKFNELPAGSTLATTVDYSGNMNVLAHEGTGASPTYTVGEIDLDVRPVLG